MDTAVVCPTCSGEGTAPGTHPETCDVCGGRGEVSQVARSFLGQVVTSRPCPRCGGYGTLLPRPCPECDGDGRVRTRRTIKVRIPAGVEDGTHIQLAGEGEVGPGGGPPGDLFLEIVSGRTRFSSARATTCTARSRSRWWRPRSAPPSAWTAWTARPTSTSAPGTQSGQVIPLYNHGVQHLNSSGRGDLIIHVTVETPARLDPDQEKLLRELAKLRGEESPPGSSRPGSTGSSPAPRRLQRPLGDRAVFLADGADLTADVIVLTGAEGRHAATVRRIRSGERVDVADGAGVIAECVVTEAGAGRVELRVQARREVPAPSRGSWSCRRCPRVTGPSWPPRR